MQNLISDLIAKGKPGPTSSAKEGVSHEAAYG